MKKKELPEDFVFDLDGLKYFPGVLPVVLAGFFAGNRTEASTYKQLERDTFPITVLPRGQDGLCCLKVHVEKFLRDGIQQPQEFLLSRKKNYVPPRKKVGRKTNREKDMEKRLQALGQGGHAN